jgi:hypothetical protein
VSSAKPKAIPFLAQNRLSDNVGSAKHFPSTPLHALGEERHFALVDGVQYAARRAGNDLKCNPGIGAWSWNCGHCTTVRRGVIRAQQTFWVVLLSRSAFRRTRSGPGRSTNRGGRAPGFQPDDQPDGRFCYHNLAKLSSPCEPTHN